MKQRLCIGIQHLNPGWKSILDQIGVWYEEVNFKHSLVEQYSVILLNGKIKSSQKKELEKYITQGGSLLEFGGQTVFSDSKKITSRRASTLINESRLPAFQHICFVDVYSKIYTHSESSILEGLIHIHQYTGGFLGFFGADLPGLLKQTSFKRKRFFNPTSKYPNEIVSKVSKHALIQVFVSLLKELHFVREMPFLKKWDSPAKKPVFCFRVDSDFGDKKSMDAVYNLAAGHNLKLTWFLHVEAHEKWLDHLHNYEKQEIALHGYTHGISRSTSKTFTNTEKGEKILLEAGFKPKGFCAPYGIWNKALEKTLRRKDFTYSSEFTYAYDGWPFYPDKSDLPLQIPIHPICTGNLKRQELNETDMVSYFDFVLINKVARFEPVIFYHHPLQTGLKAFDQIFKRVKGEGLVNLTFKEFGEFWEIRRDFIFEAYWDSNEIEINSPENAKMLFQACENHLQFDLLLSGALKKPLSQTPEFEYAKQYLPEASQVKNMRESNLQLLKTSFLDWRNRIRL